MPKILERIKNTSLTDNINYLIMLYAFSLSFSGNIVRILAGLLILVLLIDRKKFDIKCDKEIRYLYITSIVFILFCSLSFLWSNATIKDGFDYIRKFWYLLPIVTIYIYLKKDYYNKILISFICGMIISSILSFGNYYEWWAIAGGNKNNPAVFTYYIHYSIILAIAIIIVIIKLFNEKNLNLKIFFLFISLFISTNLFINLGRTGEVSLLITLIGLTLFYFRYKLKYMFIFILSVALFLSLNYFYNDQIKERIESTKSDLNEAYNNQNFNTSLGGRMGFYIISKEILSTNFKTLILGVGARQNIKPVNEIIDTKYPYLQFNKTLKSYHNFYLEIITQFGIVGLLIFLIILYRLITIGIKNEEIRLIYFSTISIYLFSNLVDLPFYKDIALSTFALIIGISLSMRKYEN